MTDHTSPPAWARRTHGSCGDDGPPGRITVAVQSPLRGIDGPSHGDGHETGNVTTTAFRSAAYDSGMVGPFDISDVGIARRVVEIQRAAYAVEAGLIGFDGIPQLHESVEDVRRRVDLEWSGAWDAGTLAGIIAWSGTDGQVDIDRLAIDPTFGRRGHGRRLVESVIGRGITVVQTGEANWPARRLYESLGFVLESTTEIGPGVVIVGMKREPSVQPE